MIGESVRRQRLGGRFGLAAVTAVSLACEDAKLKWLPVDEPQRECISYGCARAFDAQELQRFPRFLSRRDSSLVIRTATRDSILLTDLGDEAETIRYAYRQYLPAFEQHLIGIYYYEGGDYVLVSYRTGDKTVIANLPISSPDNKRFAVSSNCGDYAYCPTLIQIWRYPTDRLQLELSHAPAGELYPIVYGPLDWGPGDTYWSGPDTLVVEVLRLDT